MRRSGKNLAQNPRAWDSVDLPDVSEIGDFKTYVCVYSLDKKFRNLKTDDDPSGPEGVGQKGHPHVGFPANSNDNGGPVEQLSVSPRISDPRPRGRNHLARRPNEATLRVGRARSRLARPFARDRGRERGARGGRERGARAVSESARVALATATRARGEFALQLRS